MKQNGTVPMFVSRHWINVWNLEIKDMRTKFMVLGALLGHLGLLECGLLLFPVLGNRPELRQLLRRVGRRADGYEQHRQ
ncbi:MAG: hypothetical protein IH787_02630 [Nitrospirae bacterium]|nr:hypothetical protein [Nitrospirota bacterium]